MVRGIARIIRELEGRVDENVRQAQDCARYARWMRSAKSRRFRKQWIGTPASSEADARFYRREARFLHRIIMALQEVA